MRSAYLRLEKLTGCLEYRQGPALLNEMLLHRIQEFPQTPLEVRVSVAMDRWEASWSATPGIARDAWNAGASPARLVSGRESLRSLSFPTAEGLEYRLDLKHVLPLVLPGRV